MPRSEWTMVFVPTRLRFSRNLPSMMPVRQGWRTLWTKNSNPARTDLETY